MAGMSYERWQFRKCNNCSAAASAFHCPFGVFWTENLCAGVELLVLWAVHSISRNMGVCITRSLCKKFTCNTKRRIALPGMQTSGRPLASATVIDF